MKEEEKPTNTLTPERKIQHTNTPEEAKRLI